MVVVAQHYTKEARTAWSFACIMYGIANRKWTQICWRISQILKQTFIFNFFIWIYWISFLQTLSSQEAWCPLRSSRTTASPAKRVPLAMTRQEEARGRRIGRRRLPRLQGHRLQGQEPHSQPRTTPSVSRKEGSGSPEWQKIMCECRSPCL